MMNITLPALDLDELASRQDRLIEELRHRMKDAAEITRLRAITRDGRLRLDAATLGENRRSPLDAREMTQIVDRAVFMLSSFYVHLPAKRSLYASDPLQALRNLRAELGANPPRLDEEQFHERMTAIFVGLRDRHTNYYLPAPYRRTLAFLPFLIEAAWDDRAGRHRYLVTRIAWTPCADDMLHVPHADESPVEVTHFNGVPIERVVARNGEESSGSNRAARMARGVDRLTFRWLGLGTGPREDWVDVRFTVGDESHEQRFEWLAAQQLRPERPLGDYDTGLGRDPEGEWIRDVRETLFASVDEADTRTSPEDALATYRPHDGGDGQQYGYLRIYSFDVRPDRLTAFIDRIEGILRRAPEDGLIIDIRGNPGGNVLVAEGLLQLFSAEPISRQGIQFLNTPEALKLADAVFHALKDEAASDARSTAAPFVLLRQMPQAGMARGEQVYQGPVVLIVDANCYSASEMFAAGMQDNGLASVIGTHQQTGGGGGILWSDEAIAEVCDDADLRAQLAPLPGGASFDVAVLRTTRAGERAGVAVEDMGVVAPEIYELTSGDVLGRNEGLLACAVAKLAATSPRPLVRATYEHDTFTLRTRDLDRVDVWVDDVPVRALAVLDDVCELHTPDTLPDGRVVFRGVRKGVVVTSLRWGSAVAPAPPR